MNSYSELSFRVDKADCKFNNELWEQIVDFKLLWVREWNKWFEIYVETSHESNGITKNVSAKSLGEAELSQINLYDVEINTEIDISRGNYEPTVLYSENPEKSLLTRIMDKAPHYTVKHVDRSIRDIQRTFTFNNKSIYDAFQDISSEIGCIFIIDCYSDSNGNIIREINVYDLEPICLACGERVDSSKACSNCGSADIVNGYGNDTTIFITDENLANSITYSSDTGSVKNCFKLEAGDDLMTATIVNCNPNGSGYIWYISDSVKEDMSKELVDRINSYNKEFDNYQNDYKVNISGPLLNSYNQLINKYKKYSDNYSTITSPITGYSELMEAYYETIDFYLYLNHSLMPTIDISPTNAAKEVLKLTTDNLSPVSVKDLSTCSAATVDSAVLAMAKTVVNNRYQIKLSDTSFSGSRWSGVFTVTSYHDEEDFAVSGRVNININENYEEYVRQKIDKALRQTSENDEISDVIELFALSDSAFSSELEKYSLSRLQSFYNSCQSCIDVLIEQGVANNQTWANKNPNLYESLYIPYYNKLGLIENEIKVRENEISVIVGKYDDNGNLLKEGFQTSLDLERDKIRKRLDFESYLGRNLWIEFSAYRREDTYKNDNYISDGLNNAELFDNARKFIEVAQKDIFKSATLQHSISSNLKNLLVIKEFEPLVDYFEVGNWIRIKVDGKIYKLRLLEYEINYSKLDDISIVFSDVTIVKDGTSDVNSILSQASSMASSYDSTKRQAEQGSTSKSWLDNWVEKGLDATNIKIMSNADNQNQTWDSHGMLFREYDPVTDTYNDCQLKIINSTLAVTDDNWKTIKTAVGGFYYFDPVTGKLTYAYGVNAELLIGKLILGESLGIYSSDNSMTFDNDGLIVTNGTNTFKVNPNSSDLLVLSNKAGNILWVDDNGMLHITGDGAGLDISANKTLESNGTIQDMSSRITANAEEISTEVTRAINRENEVDGRITTESERLSSSISQTAKEIRTEVSAERTRAEEAEGALKTESERLSSSIKQTAEEIESKVEAEKIRAEQAEGILKTTTENLSSSISQTAESITSTVAKAISTFDTAGYPIDLYGFGNPSLSNYNAKENNGRYYLDQETGNVYRSNGTAWVFYETLKAHTDVVRSEIKQEADRITSTVAKATNKFDESKYAIELYGYVPAEQSPYRASDYRDKYYLDQTTGMVYVSDGNTWRQVEKLKLISDEIYSEIAQTEDRIKLGVTEQISKETDRAQKEESRLESSIILEAEKIKSTVAKSTSKYDEGKYENLIVAYGYGLPDDEVFDPSKYTLRYYLDQTNGDLYYSDGERWTKKDSLKLIVDEIYSQIEQTADAINLRVDGFDDNHNKKYTELKTTIDGVTISDQSGTTYLDGSSLKTGSVTADKLVLTGSISFNDFSSSAKSTFDDISKKSDLVQNNLDALANGEYHGTFIDGNAIYSPKFYATTGKSNIYSEFDEDSLKFYYNGLQKVGIDYGVSSEYGFEYACLRLGNDKKGYIMKRVKSDSGEHEMWIGNTNQTCGILFNFDAQTYRFYGTKLPDIT